MKFAGLVDIYRQLEATQSNIEKTNIISDLLEQAEDDELERLVKLVMGRIFTAWEDTELGFSSKLMVKVLVKTAGVSEQRVKEVWRDTGDLGSAAEELLSEGRQSLLRHASGGGQDDLTVEKVHDTLKSLAEFEGSGSIGDRINAVAKLINAADPTEVKYVVRLALRNLRLGVGEGTVRDAIVQAFFADVDTPDEFANLAALEGERVALFSGTADELDNAVLEALQEQNEVTVFDNPATLTLSRERFDRVIATGDAYEQLDGKAKQLVQHGYDVTNDFGEVAVTAKNDGLDGLEELEMQLFKPVNAMLALKVESIEEAFDTVGRPAAIDYKYDGMRAQIHGDGDKITVFTRRLEDVTAQFPDVVEAVRDQVAADRFIIDAEIIAYDPESKELIPFQKLSKRIKRKYDIDRMVEEIPVEVRPFDLIYHDGSVIDKPYRERWAELGEMVVEKKQVMRLADHAVTDSDEEAHSMQQAALGEGQEGIMMKNLDARYKPGSRVGYMVKLKPTMETLDLAIIGAKWGEGRRKGWLGRLKLGCWDEEQQEYRQIGRMATGLTDEQLEEITERLKPLITEEDGRDVVVKPEVIVEAEYEEIQQSPTYSSGYALRFPRLKAFRDDKERGDSLAKVKRLYDSQ